MPRRARDRRTTQLDALAARVDKLGQQVCRKLIHFLIPGSPRPAATPGCDACIELQRRWDEALASAAVKPTTSTTAASGPEAAEKRTAVTRGLLAEAPDQRHRGPGENKNQVEGWSPAPARSTTAAS
jgi:hypothetical protein